MEVSVSYVKTRLETKEDVEKFLDFSEPITQNSMRVVGTFWALDYDLSRRRHFPAINWTRSYTLYDCREKFTTSVAIDWPELVQAAMALLQREVELLQIVQLVGTDALAETERANWP